MKRKTPQEITIEIMKKKGININKLIYGKYSGIGRVLNTGYDCAEGMSYSDYDIDNPTGYNTGQWITVEVIEGIMGSHRKGETIEKIWSYGGDTAIIGKPKIDDIVGFYYDCYAVIWENISSRNSSNKNINKSYNSSQQKSTREYVQNNSKRKHEMPTRQNNTYDNHYPIASLISRIFILIIILLVIITHLKECSEAKEYFYKYYISDLCAHESNNLAYLEFELDTGETLNSKISVDEGFNVVYFFYTTPPHLLHIFDASQDPVKIGMNEYYTFSLQAKEPINLRLYFSYRGIGRVLGDFRCNMLPVKTWVERSDPDLWTEPKMYPLQ